MKLRYKNTGVERGGSRFNMSALAEVYVGDDSASISNLDVFLERTQEWKDMVQAFKDRDLITTNPYNSMFFEPANEEDRKRGYTL